MQRSHYARLSAYNQVAHDWFAAGKWQGMDVEIVESILPKLGVTNWDYVVADWSAMIPGLLAKRWDLMSIGMSICCDREKQVLFSAPVYRQGSGLVVAAGNPKGIHGHGTFPGHKIGAVLGSGELDDIRSISGASAVPFRTSSDMFLALKTGRIDAIEMDEGEAAYGLKASGIKGLKLLHTWDGKVWYNAALVMRKSDSNLKRALDRQIARLKANGQMLKILKTYGFGKANMVDKAGNPLYP